MLSSRGKFNSFAIGSASSFQSGKLNSFEKPEPIKGTRRFSCKACKRESKCFSHIPPDF